ncbi:MAG: MFS transporter, partial [Planctomycetota bacterium]
MIESLADRRALAYAAIVTLGGLVFGLDLGVIAGTFSYVKEQFSLSDLQVGTVGAAPGFGAIFALFFAGVLCDRIGRKRTIQLIALLYLVSAISSALAPTYWWLVAARFVGGLAFCSLALASMYIGEISPSHLRGRLVAINQFNIVVGLTLAYFINYGIQQLAQSDASIASSVNLHETAWRWMLGMEVPVALVWLLLLSLIPKSPRWLMMVGRDSEATEAMAQLMSREDIPGEIAAI